MPELEPAPHRKLRVTVDFDYAEVAQFQATGKLSQLVQHRLQNVEAVVTKAMLEARLPDALSQR